MTNPPRRWGPGWTDDPLLYRDVPVSRTSDSVILEYHARPELSERL